MADMVGEKYPDAAEQTRKDRRSRLASARVYLCTDARRERGDLVEFCARAIAGGVDIVQLRDKGSIGERQFGVLEAGEELEILAAMRQVTAAHGALLAVNDRADIARLSRADVLHVGQGDLTPADARHVIGPDVLLGLSSHTPEQAAAAASDDDVDYFCVGPCWPTPTKPDRTAPGLELVETVARRQVSKPWFAIGGIDAERLGQVRAAGAERVVVVRAITGARDPGEAARVLTDAMS